MVVNVDELNGNGVLRIGDSDDLVVVESYKEFSKSNKGQFMIGEHALVVLCTEGMAQFDYDGRTIQLRKGDLFLFLVLNTLVNNFMISPDFDCRQFWVTRKEAWNINMFGQTSISDLMTLRQHPKVTLSEAEAILMDAHFRLLCREMRESQAEKEAARRVREELNAFRDEVAEIDTKASDELIARKIRQIQERKERKEKRRKEKAEKAATASTQQQAARTSAKEPETIGVGDTVRIKGLTSVGTVEQTDGKMATVIFGGMRTKMRVERLEHAEAPRQDKTKNEERNEAIVGSYGNLSNDTRNVIDNRKLNFHQDIDVRGMRGDEAINAITYFIDDAILVGMSRVRILHGTGTGILRQLIRQYLATVPNVKHFRDEHVQFGGAGITVVDLD